MSPGAESRAEPAGDGEDWVQIDSVPETELPAHLRDGRSGDRVALVDGGLLHVAAGRATFARWGDVLGAVAHEGRAYLLVPRRPPAPPWLEVGPELLGGQASSVGALLERVRGRREGGGYRESIARRRQGMSRLSLRAKVLAREPVPGALEVPSTIVLGRSYPGLNLVQALVFFLGIGLAYVLMVGLMLALDGVRAMGLMLGIELLAAGVVLAGGFAARAIGRAWRAAKDRTLPRQRVLVLAPDGCAVGFRTGVRVLSWDQVGRFEVAPTQPSHEPGLVVLDPEGRRLGDLDGRWLQAPLPLVVAVAETYRDAAS